MIHRVWVLEVEEGHVEIFLNLSEARDYAYKQLIDWGYDPDNDEYNIFKELEESYKDERYAGFWVDELLYCYEANYHC